MKSDNGRNLLVVASLGAQPGQIVLLPPKRQGYFGFYARNSRNRAKGAARCQGKRSGMSRNWAGNASTRRRLDAKNKRKEDDEWVG